MVKHIQDEVYKCQNQDLKSKLEILSSLSRQGLQGLVLSHHPMTGILAFFCKRLSLDFIILSSWFWKNQP